MTKKFFATLLLSMLLISCGDNIEIDPNTGFEVFTIPSGAHNSIFRNEAFTGSGMDIKVIFDESAIYTLDVASDQADINKLAFLTVTKTTKARVLVLVGDGSMMNYKFWRTPI